MEEESKNSSIHTFSENESTQSEQSEIYGFK